MNAWHAGELMVRNPRQPTKEPSGKIVIDIANRGENNVEVVEQPFGGRRRGLSDRCVVRQRRVGGSECSRVFAKGLEVRAGTAAPPERNREQGGQAPCMLLKWLNPEEFDFTGRGTSHRG